MKKLVFILLSSALFASLGHAEPYYSVDTIRSVYGFEATGSLNCRVCAGKDCEIATTLSRGEVVKPSRDQNGEPYVEFVWDYVDRENKLWFYTDYACWIAANRKYLRPLY